MYTTRTYTAQSKQSYSGQIQLSLHGFCCVLYLMLDINCHALESKVPAYNFKTLSVPRQNHLQNLIQYFFPKAYPFPKFD